MEAKNREKQHASATQKKYPRHPIAMENTPEETIRRMQAFPERGEKLWELICALGRAETREDGSAATWR
ncbi:MAG: hypothetical protein DMF74_03555 [Acidobacteria bacterium]|nr:MAG: hypothetical protein DMF74_03555 [Acidobacteriota bacterium]